MLKVSSVSCASGQGYCLAPDEQARLVEAPPADVDAFTDAVFIAEGRDLQTVLKSERRAVRDVVAKYFGEKPTRDWRAERRRRRRG